MYDPFDNENLKYFDHPADVWDSRIMREALYRESSDWIYRLRRWSTFLTLTFRNDTAPDVATALYKRLVGRLNEDAFGKHYTRIVSHSYFSYVYGIEYQKRDVIHFHVLMDRPINYLKIHTLWNAWAGFGWSEIIRDREKVVNYVSKYIVKGGEIMPYKAINQRIPIVKPYWWNEDYVDIGTLVKSNE